MDTLTEIGPLSGLDRSDVIHAITNATVTSILHTHLPIGHLFEAQGNYYTLAGGDLLKPRATITHLLVGTCLKPRATITHTCSLIPSPLPVDI